MHHLTCGFRSPRGRIRPTIEGMEPLHRAGQLQPPAHPAPAAQDRGATRPIPFPTAGRAARRRRALALLAGGAVLAAVLTACGTPPWEEHAASGRTSSPSSGTSSGAPAGTAAASSPTPTTSAAPSSTTEDAAVLAGAMGAPSPSAAPADVDGLVGGRAVHEVTAGSAPVRVTYWSTLPREQWTAQAVKPLSLSIAADAGPGTTVTAVDLVVETRRDGEPTGDPQLTQVASVPPAGAAIDAPREFSWTAVLPPQDPSVTALRLLLRLEVQRATGTATPVVQTGVDELIVTLAP